MCVVASILPPVDLDLQLLYTHSEQLAARKRIRIGRLWRRDATPIALPYLTGKQLQPAVSPYAFAAALKERTEVALCHIYLDTWYEGFGWLRGCKPEDIADIRHLTEDMNVILER